MPSYVVTGSSKGLGVSPKPPIPRKTKQSLTSHQFAFLQLLSKNPSNTIIGLARNASSLESKLEKAGIPSIHVLEADVADLKSLKKAAEATAKITGGSLDVLINNAALVSEESSFKTLLD